MRLVLLCCVVLAAAGCSLRPRYAEFISATTEGAERTFRLVDADTLQPLAGVKVELSENRTKLSRTTAADGTFSLPVDKKYLAENPVFVVALPPGVKAYTLAPMDLSVPEMPPAAAPEPTPEPAPEPAPEAPAAPADADAGV